jgi:hypothetical protein
VIEIAREIQRELTVVSAFQKLIRQAFEKPTNCIIG